jgi:chitinase
VSVPILGDTMTEGTETFTVNLSVPANATIADAQGVGTIYDNEGPPSFVVTDVTGPEASSGLSFGVLLTNANSSPVGIDYADGTATAGTDYTAVSGTLTFNPGQTSKSVPVTVADDAIAEDDEAFTLSLSNATGGLAISDVQGIWTIQNDDADPTVSVAAASVDEGDLGTDTMSVPVTLSGPSGRAVDVDFATSDGTATAGIDYTTASGTLVFAAGETSKHIDITVSGDFWDEGNETITITLTAPFNADLGTDVATATITNDDAGPKLSLPDASVVEGDSGATALTFTVNITPASPIDVTVHFATSDGSAAAGNDYVAASGTVTIQAGQTTGSITVDVTGDTSYEPDETIGLLLSSPVGAKIVSGLATGTITNDDKIPTAVTLTTVKGATVVKAKGTIQPAVSGMAIKVSMLKKVGAKYRLVASKTVNVKGLKDRNGDGIVDGAYLASFPRPARGSYRFVAKYAGSALYAPIAKTLNVKL